MGTIILPVQRVPSEKINLGTIVLKSYKRVKIMPRKGLEIYSDSILINFNSKEILNNWLAFHSFIFDDFYPIDQYENAVEIIETDKKCSYTIDYADIISEIFFAEFDSNAQKIDYCELYKTYVSIEESQRDLIRNYLLKFSNKSTIINPIRNYSYWQILDYYSICESIIGLQDFCKEVYECITCKKESLHKPLVEADWIKKRMLDIIGDQGRADEYSKVIMSVRDLIRHKALHESLYPSAKYILQNQSKIIYDIEKAKTYFKEDSTALSSIESQIQDVARYLLINKIFDFHIFPHISPIISQRIV